MARRRWLLMALSLASLAFLVYAGLLLAVSVPVSEEEARVNRYPGDTAPRGGDRAVLVGLGAPWEVPTIASGDGKGTLLVLGEAGGIFPASLRDVRLARALAWVAPEANGTHAAPLLNLTGVPVLDDNGTLHRVNLTVNLTELAGDRRGFLVKTLPEENATFVPLERVAGLVDHYERPSTILLFVTTGSLGFVAPLVVLVATHRASGRPGVGDALEGACPECRAPAPPGADFCLRCGAWMTDGRGEP